MNKLLSIRQAADLLGVSTKTIRRWEQEGKIRAMRTAGGHRRFNISELLGSQKNAPLTIAYLRASQNHSQNALGEKISSLQSYCSESGWNFQVIKDLSRSIGPANPGLIRLIKLICSQQVKRLVLANKEELSQLAKDLVFTLCEIFGTEVIILNHPGEVIVEEDLSQELKEIIEAFNTRLYSNRHLKNPELVEELKEVAQKL